MLRAFASCAGSRYRIVVGEADRRSDQHHSGSAMAQVKPTVKFNTALIVGAGSGLSAALARTLSTEGIKVALAARSTDDLAELAQEIGAAVFTCDAGRHADVERLFADLDAGFGAPEIVIYN